MLLMMMMTTMTMTRINRCSWRQTINIHGGRRGILFQKSDVRRFSSGLLTDKEDIQKATSYTTTLDISKCTKLLSNHDLLYKEALKDVSNNPKLIDPYLERIYQNATSFIQSDEIWNHQEVKTTLHELLVTDGHFICMKGVKNSGKSKILSTFEKENMKKVFYVNMRKSPNFFDGLLQVIQRHYLQDSKINNLLNPSTYSDSIFHGMKQIIQSRYQYLKKLFFPTRHTAIQLSSAAMDLFTVRSYLQSRNISVSTAKVFQLGYAPRLKNGGSKSVQTNATVWSFWEDIKPHSLLSWFSTRARLNGSDPIQAAIELEEAGLVVNASKYGRATYFDNHNFYDRFRHRLMIPIRDIEGNILGYGGRELPDNSTQTLSSINNETLTSNSSFAAPAETPTEISTTLVQLTPVVKKSLGKYVNTPTTPVFKKKETLFNIDIAAKSRQSHQCVIIVEGYFDVIALYEIGIKNVVASMGTALSLNQLFRAANLTSTGEVIILFDQDIPGQRATERVSTLIDSLQNPSILKKYQHLIKEIRHPIITIKSASITEAIQYLIDAQTKSNSTETTTTPSLEEKKNVDHDDVLLPSHSIIDEKHENSDSNAQMVSPPSSLVPSSFQGLSLKKISKIKDCADVVQSFEKDIAQKIILTMMDLSKPLKTIKF